MFSFQNDSAGHRSNITVCTGISELSTRSEMCVICTELHLRVFLQMDQLTVQVECMKAQDVLC